MIMEVEFKESCVPQILHALEFTHSSSVCTSCTSCHIPLLLLRLLVELKQSRVNILHLPLAPSHWRAYGLR